VGFIVASLLIEKQLRWIGRVPAVRESIVSSYTPLTWGLPVNQVCSRFPTCQGQRLLL